MEAEICPQKFSPTKLPFIIDRSKLNLQLIQGMSVQWLVWISRETPLIGNWDIAVKAVKCCSLSTNCKKTYTIFRVYDVKYFCGVSMMSLERKPELHSRSYEGWNFNFGNTAVTFDTAHLQSSYFHRPSIYSPKLCRTRSQRWRSRMMPLAAPVLLMVRTERSTAEGLNPPCNCPIQ